MDSWIHLLTKKIPAYGFPCVFADKAACLYFILPVVKLGCAGVRISFYVYSKTLILSTF